MAAPSGELLTNPGELLFRQVNPAFIHKDRVSSQAFCPTPKDDGLLSTSRGSVTTPEAAYSLYVEELGFRSAGVWGVTVGECEGQQLACYADPSLSKSKIRRIASLISGESLGGKLGERERY